MILTLGRGYLDLQGRNQALNLCLFRKVFGVLCKNYHDHVGCVYSEILGYHLMDIVAESIMRDRHGPGSFPIMIQVCLVEDLNMVTLVYL